MQRGRAGMQGALDQALGRQGAHAAEAGEARAGGPLRGSCQLSYQVLQSGWPCTHKNVPSLSVVITTRHLAGPPPSKLHTL